MFFLFNCFYNLLDFNCADGSKKKHNRSPSHFDLKYGRESPSCKTSLEDIYQISSNEPFETKDEFEVRLIIKFIIRVLYIT